MGAGWLAGCQVAHPSPDLCSLVLARPSPSAQFVLAFTILAQTVGMPLGPWLEQRAGLGPRRTALLGAALMGGGVLASSFATSLATFVPFYCVVFGLGVGIAYQMPILSGSKWFPRAKGAVSGTVIFGMGASAFFFNMLATRLANPLGLNPVGALFPPSVYAAWPSLLRTLGSIYLLVSISVCMRIHVYRSISW